MAVTAYTVLDGEILSENRNGTQRQYVPDPQGNTVALLDTSTAIVKEFSYWSFGGLKSGDVEATKYRFGGTYGGRSQWDGGIYFRNRVADPEDGRWLTVDPLWPDEAPFAYCRNSPATAIDANGNRPCFSFYLDFCRLYCKREAKKHGWKFHHWHCDQIVEVTFYCWGLMRYEKTLTVHCTCTPKTFPPGRNYRNCRQAYNACVMTGGGMDRGRQCLNCLRRCENWGMSEWLKGDCRFWERDSDFWGFK